MTPLTINGVPFQLVFWAVSQVIGLESPGDLKLAKVRRIDLIERTVSGTYEVAAIRRPFAGPSVGLSGNNSAHTP